MVLTLFPPSRSDPTLLLPRIYMRQPQRGDWQEWAELRALSRDFLVPWEPTWPEDALTRAAFRRRLARYAEDWTRDQSYSFFLFRRDDDALLGGITIANVRRGVAQSCTFGYWIGKPFSRHGFMTEAVHGACCFAFDRLSLHRVEAATLPHNEASQGVLRKCGFEEEGLARRYLKIDGKWQDHVLFALLREEFDPTLPPT
ncbi:MULTISPECIES: GNAT family N-acetyltransferase [Thalassobaculum]|uniref:Ribosomal-protein-alanine N-acetyltransferase n=1 Tax=Thalassobaculum litoreum DSM 18839 TaxID=1123362 RepID=A0A8G2EXA7_9PROT|nr:MULTISPECIES: GNAT family protein [Thalassobaculum]SDG11497.1 ribosomal-protein-alanine N-acetyltransferase [Thalassobaculum litoreum DSM 18839]